MAKRDHTQSQAYQQAQAEIEAAPLIMPAPAPYADIPTPHGWAINRAGVFEVKSGKEGEPDKLEAVSGCIWVIGLTTGTAGDWGRLLAFIDHDGKTKELAIPAARLHEDPAILARELANAGLRIIPSKERRLVAYLASHTTEARIQSAPRLGWMDRTDGGLAFVFPNSVLSARGDDRVVYQPERYSPTVGTVRPSGTLRDWQGHIANAVAGNDLLLFALCAGLTPPWLKLADSDSFIVHLHGTTSRGKTALAQVAASVWGCAVDPAESAALSFIKRWNTTGNGLEGLAEAHSDLVLCLDELGASTNKDPSALIYQLAGGQGKNALNQNREIKAPRAWRTVGISTGEMSLEAVLSSNGKPVKGGLLHRALDIEVTDIAGHLPEDQRAAFVTQLKRDCAKFYGTAGDALIKAIIAQYPSLNDARTAAREAVDTLTQQLTQPHHAPEQARALRRFALIAWAGTFAARHGVLPINPALIRQAVARIAEQWGSTTTGTDTDRIIEAVRAFILKHGARFQPLLGDGHEVQNRAGFRDHGNDRWLFTREALQEAAQGHDVKTITTALKNGGHLFTNENRTDTKVSTPAGRMRMYCVKGGLFDDEPSGQPLNSMGQVGQVGQSAPECGLEAAPSGENTLGHLGQPAKSAPVPQATKYIGAGANPHQSRPNPIAPSAPVKNSVSHKKSEIISGANL